MTPEEKNNPQAFSVVYPMDDLQYFNYTSTVQDALQEFNVFGFATGPLDYWIIDDDDDQNKFLQDF